jgi:hypothetical protein
VARLRAQFGEEILVERAPVHANAHRLVIINGELDDGTEVLVAPFGAHVPRVYAVLVERACALGMTGKKEMPVVMEVSDDGHVHSVVLQPPADFGNGGGRLIVVDGNAHHL